MEWTYRLGAEGDSLLRMLLAGTHGVGPADVELPRRSGAPEARIDGRRVEVSKSRSHGYVAVACAGPGEDCALGVDIEAVRPFLESATESSMFAEVVLAPEESAWFHATAGDPEARRLLWLLRTWVRKEAVLKSLHTGFDVHRGGMSPAAVVLNEPWSVPSCLSHPQVSVVDLPTPQDAPVILAAARVFG